MNSTALSDLVLLVAVLVAMAALVRTCTLRHSVLAVAGFGLIALAAGLGVLRYGFVPQVEEWHRQASSIARIAGLPLLALGVPLAIGLARLTRRAALLILASVACTLAGGLLIGNRGLLMGIPRVDLLHYCLAAAQLMLAAALVEADRPREVAHAV